MDFDDLMKQAGKLKEELAKRQEELAHKIFEGESGGGMVTAKVNGRHELVSLKIDPELVNSKDVSMVEDLVKAAVNDAFAKAKNEVQGLFSKMMMGGGAS